MLEIKEIEKLIEQDKFSIKKRNARIGEKYYNSHHDIENYKIYYYDGNGELKQDLFKSNIRISHPFFTELVDQQVQYMLSNTDGLFKTDIPELQKELDQYFDDDFYSEIFDLLTGTVSKGFDYIYGATDKNGRIRFSHADSMGVIEVRAKETEDNCDYLIYWYVDRISKDNKKITKIQVWDKDKVYFFAKEEGKKLEEDYCVEIEENIYSNRYHTLVTNRNKVLGKGFGFIPFWRLDNNQKQVSGLNSIKSLIDDYDLMACSLSNNLQDFTDALYIVQGFEGDNLNELIQNIKAKKHVGLPEGGGLEIKTIDIPYEARKVKLELDEKNIYRFGMGFNSTQIGDGNITNIVIKSRYALLDLKCNKLEIRLKQLFRKLLEVVLEEINTRNKTDYKTTDVYFDFNREIMTNAQDNAQIELIDAQRQQVQINTILGLHGVLDDETIIQNICDVLDIDYNEIKNKIPKEENTADEALEVLNE